MESGTRLGHYEILEQFGVGGMGVVYRARDTLLDRDVALKMLPEEFASDPERLVRLKREAKLLASINHPNICAVYGFEDEGGHRFVVMEAIGGETLSERIASSGQIEVEETMAIARQIAEALEAAHESGVIHRDLKPANVKVTPDCKVKVLDFGLGKVYTADPSAPHDDQELTRSPTLEPETQAGAVLGTAPYMSPEQARGHPVDKRTDIWAFGCVLYEMLAGRRAFEGDTMADVLAAVMTQSVKMDALPSSVSPALRVLLGRCLERDPRKRLRDIGEARIALEYALAGAEGATLPGAAASFGAPGSEGIKPRVRVPWLAAALGALATIFGLLWLGNSGDSALLLQSSLAPAPAAMLEPSSGFALSPDGRSLAFVARDVDGATRLWIRSLASLEARVLAGTEGASQPFWSHDGHDLGFFADQGLNLIPAAGGAVRRIAGSAFEPKGGAWNAAGRIVYTPDYRTGLFEVRASGGEPRILTRLDVVAGEQSHRFPQFLPDGRTLLFLVQTAEAGVADDRSHIEVLDADGTRHEILQVNSSATYSPSGELLFWREGSIYAREFDPESLRLGAEPQRLVNGVGFTINEWATFSVSAEGTLVYHRGAALPWRLEWRDRFGRLLSEAAPYGEYLDFALSPDGSRVLYVADSIVLWVRDLVRGTDTRLSFEEVDHYAPAWAPRGDWIAYVKQLPGVERGSVLVRTPSSGVGDKEVLYRSTSTIRSISWSPNGRWVVLQEEQDALLLLDLESGKTRIRVDSPGLDLSPALSPDGQWLAYSSNESGRQEVYVVPTFDGADKWQVSNRGGIRPQWSPEGDELFFLGLDNDLSVATFAPAGEPVFGLPQPLFSLPDAGPGLSYRISPDGRLLVRVQRRGGGENFTLVQNWPRLLEGRRR